MGGTRFLDVTNATENQGWLAPGVVGLKPKWCDGKHWWLHEALQCLSHGFLDEDDPELGLAHFIPSLCLHFKYH